MNNNYQYMHINIDKIKSLLYNGIPGKINEKFMSKKGDIKETIKSMLVFYKQHKKT